MTDNNTIPEKKLKKQYRSVTVGYTVGAGQDVLETGMFRAQKLWNEIWWCQIGYNQALMRERNGKVAYEKVDKSTGEIISVYGLDYPVATANLPYKRGVRYLGNFGIQKEVKDHWAAKGLSDRCFSYTVKDFDIAMKSWFANVKSRPQMRPPKPCKSPRGLTFEVGRNAKHLDNWHMRLTVLGGKGDGRHTFIKLMPPPTLKLVDVKIFMLLPDGTARIVYQVEVEESIHDSVAGIDLGITNIAAVAFSNGESILYSGKGVKSVDQLYHKKVSKTRAENWSAGKRSEKQSQRAKSLQEKHGNKRGLWIHNLTTDIVEQCVKRDVGIIVIGKLTGIRDNKNFGKKQNQQLHAWPFMKITEQIKYKASAYGIEVKQVSEAYTSQTCCLCKQVRKSNRKTRGLYVCKECGVKINADVNGSFNILNKVSPSPQGVGVAGDFPTLPSPHISARIGKDGLSQINPTFVAKFDLRNNMAVRHYTC